MHAHDKRISTLEFEKDEGSFIQKKAIQSLATEASVAESMTSVTPSVTCTPLAPPSLFPSPSLLPCHIGAVGFLFQKRLLQAAILPFTAQQPIATL